MSTPALHLESVVKAYGSHKAMDSMSFSIPTGTICAFVGPNGAGKTTTFSVISGFVSADSGVVNVLGEGPFDPYRLKGRLGVLPQDAELSLKHTPREFLVHLARLGGMARTPARTEAQRLLQLVRLNDRADHKIGALSHGMRRRVAVASALVGSPELVLLDEPMAGLDPAQAASLRQNLVELRGVQTLVISSHNLHELERMCDWVVMVDNGALVAQGPMSEVTGKTTRLEWTVGPGQIPMDAIRALLPHDAFEIHGRVVRHDSTGDLDASTVAVMGALVEAGVPLRGLQRGAGLEQRFMSATAPQDASP